MKIHNFQAIAITLAFFDYFKGQVGRNHNNSAAQCGHTWSHEDKPKGKSWG
jgi:hypothetical protein